MIGIKMRQANQSNCSRDELKREKKSLPKLYVVEIKINDLRTLLHMAQTTTQTIIKHITLM